MIFTHVHIFRNTGASGVMVIQIYTDFYGEIFLNYLLISNFVHLNMKDSALPTSLQNLNVTHLFYFSSVAVNKSLQTSGLKQISHNSDGRKPEFKMLAMFVPSRSSGEEFSCFSPSSWWLWTTRGIPWLVAISLQTLCGLHVIFLLYLCVFFLSNL